MSVDISSAQLISLLSVDIAGKVGRAAYASTALARCLFLSLAVSVLLTIILNVFLRLL